MTDWQAPASVHAALRGLCPRCGAPGLFRGAVSFAPRCPSCALDFASFNVGDGPAAFLILIVGTLVTAGAAIMQIKYAPPLWVQALIWLPVTAIASFWLLRVAKALLLLLEYRNAAREGGGGA
jgi:uncharacterized protein (DUF983 family)